MIDSIVYIQRKFRLYSKIYSKINSEIEDISKFIYTSKSLETPSFTA